MKTFKVTITEEELIAIIEHHAHKMSSYEITPERSARIHDLTKRLHKETPEIENDPRPPMEQTKQEPNWQEAPQTATAEGIKW